MKSIERRFIAVSTNSPELSSYICFAKAIRDQGFTRRIVRNWFDKLVEKEDYLESDANSLVGELTKLSKHPEDDTFRTEFARRKD